MERLGNLDKIKTCKGEKKAIKNNRKNKELYNKEMIKFIETEGNGSYQGLGGGEKEELLFNGLVFQICKIKNSGYLFHNNVNTLTTTELYS